MVRSIQIIQKEIDAVSNALNKMNFKPRSVLQKKEKLLAELEFSKKYKKETTSCIDKDRVIKLLDVDISNRLPKTFSGSKKVWNSEFVRLSKDLRFHLQSEFVNEDCAFKIENIKAQETAGIIGSEIEKYEDDVLGGSSKTQKSLFIIGGVVLLVALGIIVYSNKKK